MAKIPYIPLYIGDWEQDTNALSLATEAAWLKVIFKMFKDDRSGIYKTSTKALQNLWKSDTNGVQNILEELQDNNVCIIEKDETAGRIVFKNRRMLKEKSVSKARTKAVLNRYKQSTKEVQNPDYDNEYENEASGNIGGEGEKGEPEKPETPAPATDPGAFLVPRMFTAWKQAFPKYPLMQETDFPALHDLAHCLADQLAKPKDFGDKAICNAILELWYSLVEHVKGHSHFSTYNLPQVAKYIQSILQSYHKPKAPDKSGIQYLYERFLDGEKVARLITDEHYQQLNAMGLVAVDAALLKQTQATRLKALDSPQNANERELHTLYKAGKLDDPLVVTDRAGVELKAKRTAIHNFFRRQKEAKATDVLTVKK